MKNALLILCLATLSVCADDFYIWQRDWNERVREAVRSERAAERFYFLEGELTAERFPRGFAAKKLTRGMIPVYRIHTSALRFSAEEIAEKIFDARFPEIQLDLDCPERIFARYAEIVRALKAKGVKRISATVLPVHLKLKEFPEFAKNVDFYVLQVHGLDFRKGASLMRMSTVEESLARAEKLNLPYKVALPCYAYELFFRDGRLVSLNAEQGRANRGGKRTVLAAEPEELAESVRKIRKLKRGIIWFRLPVRGDRLCLDRPSLQKIMDGEKIEKRMEFRWKKSKDRLYILYVKNIAMLGAERVALRFSRGNFQADDYGFFGGFQPEAGHVFGLFPESLTGPAPLPGEESAAMWLRSNDEPPKLKVEFPE